MFWSVTKIYFNGYSFNSYLTKEMFLKEKDCSKTYTWFKLLYIHKKKWRSTKEGSFDLSSHSFTRAMRGDIKETFCYRTRAIVKIISDVFFKVSSSFLLPVYQFLLAKSSFVLYVNPSSPESIVKSFFSNLKYWKRKVIINNQLFYLNFHKINFKARNKLKHIEAWWSHVRSKNKAKIKWIVCFSFLCWIVRRSQVFSEQYIEQGHYNLTFVHI